MQYLPESKYFLRFSNTSAQFILIIFWEDRGCCGDFLGWRFIHLPSSKKTLKQHIVNMKGIYWILICTMVHLEKKKRELRWTGSQRNPFFQTMDNFSDILFSTMLLLPSFLMGPCLITISSLCRYCSDTIMHPASASCWGSLSQQHKGFGFSALISSVTYRKRLHFALHTFFPPNSPMCFYFCCCFVLELDPTQWVIFRRDFWRWGIISRPFLILWKTAYNENLVTRKYLKGR